MEKMKFIDYLRKVNEEESEFDACVGDVDMLATYCGDSDMYLDNPYLHEKYGELLNAECYIIDGRKPYDTPVCVVDDVSDELGHAFFMSAAGYCDVTEYSKLFEKTEEMEFPNIPEYQREYAGDAYYCVDVTDSVKDSFGRYFHGLVKAEISFPVGAYTTEEEAHKSAKDTVVECLGLKDRVELCANTMFLVFKDGSVLKFYASEEALLKIVKKSEQGEACYGECFKADELTAIKGHYLRAYEVFFDECIERAMEGVRNGEYPLEMCVTGIANELFEEYAQAEHVAGYYLSVYKERSSQMWKANMEGRQPTSQDMEVGEILVRLCGEV